MSKSLQFFPVLLGLSALSFNVVAHDNHECPNGFPDDPVLPGHVSQSDINDGTLSLNAIVDAGKTLFVAPFNRCDGQGRPATTGGGAKRVADEPAKLRTSAPDSDACAGCHNQPRAGGAGDFVANVFVLAQTLDPVTFSVAPEFSDDRNTLGMNGSGPLEMLAREMTIDLQSQAAGKPDGNHTLSTKGVDFDIEVSGGEVVQADGIATDLVVRIFHQIGAVVSLREFTDNAMNHHHGMQAVERFDLNPAMGFDTDFDEDGVNSELSVGDITAITIFQAQLGVPGRVMPGSKKDRNMVDAGEAAFADNGCTSCHMPEMVLNTRVFVEPNPFNPPGTCSDSNVCPDYSYDMTEDGEGPLLEKGNNGTAVIRAYTDLKRHTLCDEEGSPGAIRYFCNELLAQGRADQDGRDGTEFFLTRKLWDVGNSAPYGHRGDVSTIHEAIMLHGGEGRASRDAYAASSNNEQASVVKFLKTLQVVPTQNGDDQGGKGKGKGKG